MTANKQVGTAYVFFKSGMNPKHMHSKIRELQTFHPLVELYSPGNTDMVRGDQDLMRLCEKFGSKGFNQALKIIARDRPNFSALGESLVIIDCMIKRRILEEGNFAFITYKAKHKAKRKYRKLQIPLDPKHQ